MEDERKAVTRAQDATEKLNEKLKKMRMQMEETVSINIPWCRSLSYKNQSTEWLRKSMDWFLYDRDLCHERVK